MLLFKLIEFSFILSSVFLPLLNNNISFNPLKESSKYELLSAKSFLYSTPASFAIIDETYGITNPTIKKNTAPKIPNKGLIRYNTIVIIKFVNIAIAIGAIVWA